MRLVISKSPVHLGKLLSALGYQLLQYPVHAQSDCFGHVLNPFHLFSLAVGVATLFLLPCMFDAPGSFGHYIVRAGH